MLLSDAYLYMKQIGIDATVFSLFSCILICLISIIIAKFAEVIIILYAWFWN